MSPATEPHRPRGVQFLPQTQTVQFDHRQPPSLIPKASSLYTSRLTSFQKKRAQESILRQNVHVGSITNPLTMQRIIRWSPAYWLLIKTVFGPSHRFVQQEIRLFKQNRRRL